jgi:hypothetical protein
MSRDLHHGLGLLGALAGLATAQVKTESATTAGELPPAGARSRSCVTPCRPVFDVCPFFFPPPPLAAPVGPPVLQPPEGGAGENAVLPEGAGAKGADANAPSSEATGLRSKVRKYFFDVYTSLAAKRDLPGPCYAEFL